ncbi:Uncharacterised protein [Serratia fonticola]|nr:Uncharacterised protein [Serratia fonticola]
MNDQDIEKELQSKGLNAPRITPEHIQRVQKCGQYFRFPGTTVIVCCITLENGYTVTGESACASPENFDEEIGSKIALQNAVSKIWGLEGYLLRQKLHEQELAEPCRPEGVSNKGSGDNPVPTSGLLPHQQRVSDELQELQQRLDKLTGFIAGDAFSTLPEQDQRLLEAQSHIMSAYVEVLTQRTKRF